MSDKRNPIWPIFRWYIALLRIGDWYFWSSKSYNGATSVPPSHHSFHLSFHLRNICFGVVVIERPLQVKVDIDVAYSCFCAVLVHPLLHLINKKPVRFSNFTRNSLITGHHQHRAAGHWIQSVWEKHTVPYHKWLIKVEVWGAKYPSL